MRQRAIFAAFARNGIARCFWWHSRLDDSHRDLGRARRKRLAANPNDADDGHEAVLHWLEPSSG
jgi:hypothetical protein